MLHNVTILVFICVFTKTIWWQKYFLDKLLYKSPMLKSITA